MLVFMAKLQILILGGLKNQGNISQFSTATDQLPNMRQKNFEDWFLIHQVIEIVRSIYK